MRSGFAKAAYLVALASATVGWFWLLLMGLGWAFGI
jgi:hypothetical protein